MTAAGKPKATRPIRAIRPSVPAEPEGPDVVVFHPEELTVGEIEEIEDASGLPISWLVDPEKPSGLIYRAVAYVLRKRDDPAFTMEDAKRIRVFIRAEPSIPPTVESA